MTYSNALIRAVGLLLATLVAGGCTTYHQPYYVNSGAYFHSAGAYGGAAGQARAAYALPNPALYPFWSVDYFYFSRHYHPYSVYVGYHEPLYYPYPGWALGYHRPAFPLHSAGYGYGYGFPWHGPGHRYPGYSVGFFAGHHFHDGLRGGHRRGHHDHRIRHIDRRLAELQHQRTAPSRRELLTARAREAGGRPVASAAGIRSRSFDRREIMARQQRSRTLEGRGVPPGRRAGLRNRNELRSTSGRAPSRGGLQRRSPARMTSGDRSTRAPIEHLRRRDTAAASGNPGLRGALIRRAQDAPERGSRGSGAGRRRTAPPPRRSADAAASRRSAATRQRQSQGQSRGQSRGALRRAASTDSSRSAGRRDRVRTRGNGRRPR